SSPTPGRSAADRPSCGPGPFPPESPPLRSLRRERSRRSSAHHPPAPAASNVREKGRAIPTKRPRRVDAAPNRGNQQQRARRNASTRHSLSANLRLPIGTSGSHWGPRPGAALATPGARNPPLCSSTPRGPFVRFEVIDAELDAVGSERITHLFTIACPHPCHEGRPREVDLDPLAEPGTSSASAPQQGGPATAKRRLRRSAEALRRAGVLRS